MSALSTVRHAVRRIGFMRKKGRVIVSRGSLIPALVPFAYSGRRKCSGPPVAPAPLSLLLPNRGFKKVFSAYVASRSIIDGVWPYWDGRCRILSWKRGVWEDRVVAEQVEPRTLAHLLHAGLTRT